MAGIRRDSWTWDHRIWCRLASHWTATSERKTTAARRTTNPYCSHKICHSAWLYLCRSKNKRMLIPWTPCIGINRIIVLSCGSVERKCDLLQSCCGFNIFTFTWYVIALGRRFCIRCNEHAHYVTFSRKGRNCNTHSAVYRCLSSRVLWLLSVIPIHYQHASWTLRQSPDVHSLSQCYVQILTRDFRLPSRCKRNIRSSGTLRSVDWQVPTFRYNLPVPSVRASSSFEMGPMGCLETSVSDYHSALHNITEELRCYTDCRPIASRQTFTEFRPRRGAGGREWRENSGIAWGFNGCIQKGWREK